MSAYEVWDELIRGSWTLLTQWRTEAKPEGLHLDYKEANWTGKDISDDDRKNLAKNLSGFGNVDGGVLVFGAATTTVASTKLEVLNALKGVSPLDQYEERVRVYVKTSTEPPVPGVIVQKIGDPTQTNHGIVIVYIPLTDMGPFRARGPKQDVADKYFMRTTSDTLVMPHQILAASFGRRPFPRLRFGVERQEDRRLLLHVENVGRGPAVAPFVRLKFATGFGNVFERGSWRDKKFDVASAGWKLAFALPMGDLIYPGERRNIAAIDVPGEEHEFTVRLDCENAQPIELTERVKLQMNAIVWLESPTV